jgi:hypothetical protein
MYVLRIEHPVPDYEAWKQAFDGDPVGRERSGVRRYRIMRALDDPNQVMIDLEFDTAEGARGLLEGMRAVWGRVQGDIISEGTQARVVEVAEAAALS